MGPIIPDALIKYINDTDGSKLLPNPDGSSVGSLEDGVYTSDLVFLLISLGVKHLLI